jgi:hypothetical protein
VNEFVNNESNFLDEYSIFLQILPTDIETCIITGYHYNNKIKMIEYLEKIS